MVRCMSCRATVSNLSLIPVIEEHLSDQASARDSYELSSYGATLQWLKANMRSVATSEYFPNHPMGMRVNGILNQDVHKLTFADQSFDVVTSNHVFEHVADDMAGFREISRVLKPRGAMIVSFPLYDIPSTLQNARLADGELVFMGQPEYHDSRLGGPKSAPVFWRHSINDICDRVRAAGFHKAELKDVRLTRVQRDPALVVYAIK